MAALVSFLINFFLEVSARPKLCRSEEFEKGDLLIPVQFCHRGQITLYARRVVNPSAQQCVSHLINGVENYDSHFSVVQFNNKRVR